MALALVIHHAAGITEADCVRWAGVIVGAVGAVAVAPTALGLLLREVVSKSRKIQHDILKKLGWRRPTVQIAGIGAAVMSRFGGSARARVLGGTTSQRLDLLEKEVGELYQICDQQHREIEQQAGKAADDRAAIRRELQGIRDDLARRDQRDEQLDARGLPLIALGILMTGVPDGLAEVTVLGFFFIVTAVGLSAWAVVRLVPIRRRRGTSEPTSGADSQAEDVPDV